jgi:hypothetical protein
MAARPIVIVDTSIFIADALSPTRRGAASQVLAVLPAVAHVVLCDEIVTELGAKLEEHLGWSAADMWAVYGPVLEAALWVAPVPERTDHRRAVNDDAGDTMLVRAAEAVYADLPDIVEADQLRFIASANTTDLRPGADYAGFRFGTAHDVLLALGARRS